MKYYLRFLYGIKHLLSYAPQASLAVFVGATTYALALQEQEAMSEFVFVQAALIGSLLTILSYVVLWRLKQPVVNWMSAKLEESDEAIIVSSLKLVPEQSPESLSFMLQQAQDRAMEYINVACARNDGMRVGDRVHLGGAGRPDKLYIKRINGNGTMDLGREL